MNTDIPVLEVDDAGAAGIPGGIKSAYAAEGGGYAIAPGRADGERSGVRKAWL